ncbi:MAG: quinate 5-dehydrogenase [Firmicutes bacterium]|nr:quinate 5-dehydrogenase [Bacillota bacterium]
MKEIVSVSLGSRHRDHESQMTLMGETVHVARRGSDGDLDRARDMIRALDGTVDALGLGGIDRYLVVRNRRYEIQDAVRMASEARKTPVVDGSGIKNTLERTIVEELHADGTIHRDQHVLMVSAMDRFGMAESFDALGYQLVAGDLIFSSHINYPIRTVDELDELARKLLPEVTQMPFHHLYPVGDAQTGDSDPRYRHYFEEADIIAGDFHYIRRYMPESLEGKIIITNTTTEGDVALLAAKGVQTLVTTTPVVDGRSYGTNVIEAALVAVTGLTAESPGWSDAVHATGLHGTVLRL